MSMVSWFHRFPCWFHVFMGFVVCNRFLGVKGFIVSSVLWFHRFRGVNSFIGFIGFVVSMVS